MDIAAELTRLFGLQPTKSQQVTLGGEVFGQGGYLSFRRQVTITREGSEPPLHLFIKSSDVTRSDLDDATKQTSDHFCRTECIFYGLMGPVLERVLGQLDLEPVFPRVYHQKISDAGTILVMEDMTKQGFSLAQQGSFGVQHAYCVVKALAGLQAAYWVARVDFNYTLDSTLFSPESPFSESLKKSGLDFRPMIEENVAYFYENLGRHVNSAEDKKLIVDYMDGFTKNLIADPTGSMPSLANAPIGLVHGDLWFSNFMFKGGDGALTCRLFDWQFWVVGLFGFDLGVLMVSGLPTQMLQEHIDQIPATFYRTFRDIYERRTGSPVPFSEEAALANMRHTLTYAMFWVIVVCRQLWENRHLDVPNLLANLAFVIRSERI